MHGTVMVLELLIASKRFAAFFTNERILRNMMLRVVRNYFVQRKATLDAAIGTEARMLFMMGDQ